VASASAHAVVQTVAREQRAHAEELRQNEIVGEYGTDQQREGVYHSGGRQRTCIPGTAPESGEKQKDLLAAGAGRQHHALRFAETHFARLQIRHHDGETSDQRLRRIRGFDSREDLPPRLAEIEHQPDQFVGAVDVLRRNDASHPQVDAIECIDVDQVLGRRIRGRSGARLSRGGRACALRRR
jgi:hypothetical protein